MENSDGFWVNVSRRTASNQIWQARQRRSAIPARYGVAKYPNFVMLSC